ALRRLAEGTHQLNALVRVVDSNVVAALAQPGRDELTERRIAGRAVTVAQHEIGMHQARLVGGVRAGDAGHGVAVDVPDLAVARMCGVDQLAQARVVWLPAGIDAMPHFVHAEFAVVQRRAVVQHAPYQAFAQLYLGRFRQRLGPGLIEQLRIDFLDRTVGVDIGTWKRGRDQRHAHRYRIAPQVIDPGVFRRAQCAQGRR